MSDETRVETSPDIEIANIVASGKLNLELELAPLAEDLRNLDWIDEVEHSRRQGNRLLIQFAGEEVLGIVAPTGVYVFTGVDSYDEIETAKTLLFQAFSALGIIDSVELKDSEIIDEFRIQNVVCTTELSDHRNLDLTALTTGLGLENTEYEPEQFPGLIFRPSDISCTILIFASGKVVITGVVDERAAQEAFLELRDEVDYLLS